MSTEALYPNTIHVQTNLTGTVADIDDDPDSPDSNWLDAPDTDANTYLEVSFPDASGALTTGTDVQEFRVQVGATLGNRSPDRLRFYLYEGGTLRATLYDQSSPTITATSSGGQVISLTWNASDLSTQDANADVRLIMECDADTHPPAQETTVEVGAVKWNVDYSASGSQTISDMTFISSGNTTHLPSLCRPPHVAGYTDDSPFFVGDTIGIADLNMSWIDHADVSNFGDIPPGTSYEESGSVSYWSGTLTTAGTYDVQTFATSAACLDAYSDVVQVKVQHKLSATFISSGNQLFLPDVDHGVPSEQTITDMTYIASGNATYLPVVEIDTGSQTITDTDFISSGNTTYVPFLCRPPHVASFDNGSPFFEGDVIGIGDWYHSWVDHAAISNIGDTPGGLTFQLSGSIAYFSGTLSIGSAGTHNLQTHATSAACLETDSQIDQFVVQKRLSATFISSGNELYTPDVDHAAGQTINDTDFITSGNTTYLPDVLASDHTITDTDFISSGNSIYEPTLSGGIGKIGFDGAPTGWTTYNLVVNGLQRAQLSIDTNHDGEYTPSQNEQIYEIGLYSRSDNAAIAEVAVYDITSGVNGATLVDYVSINDGADGYQSVSCAINLTSGNTYALFVKTTTGTWQLYYKYPGTSNWNTLSDTYIGSSSWPSSWDGTLDHNLAYGPMYAYTQPAPSSQTIDDLNFISSGSVLYTPDLTLSNAINDTDFIASGNSLFLPTFVREPLWVMGHFRFENDDGTDLDDSTFMAAEDTVIGLNRDRNFRLRINWGSSTPNPESTVFQAELAFKINEGSWQEVGAATAIQYVDSTILLDGITSTLERLATPPSDSNAYVVTYFDENGISSGGAPDDQYYEFVFNLKTSVAQPNLGDTVYFALFDKSDAKVFTVVDTIPVLTIVALLTINDTDFISSGNQLFAPDVDHDTTEQTINDLGFIGSGNALYDPSTLHPYEITDTDFIGSGNSLFTPDLGRAPYNTNDSFKTYNVEGDIVLNASNFFNWADADSLDNVGDMPDGLSFGTIATSISYIQGTLSDASAGTYTIQHSATNQYGTRLSVPVTYYVHERIQSDYIPSGNQLFDPNVSSGETYINDTDFISSGNSLYLPDILPQEYTIADTDFIGSGNTLYDPNVTSGAAPQTITDFNFIASGNSLFTPDVLPQEVTITDTDFIASGNELYLPFLGSGTALSANFIPSSSSLYLPDIIPQEYTITDLDFIGSGSSVYTPVLGIKPTVNAYNIATLRLEGTAVSGLSNCWVNWSDADSLENVGDIPPDTVFLTVGSTISYLNGTLSNSSAGYYTIQFKGINTFGETLGPAIELFVSPAIEIIPSGNTTFDPDVIASDVRAQIDYIGSGNTTYLPSVIPSTYTINDVDFIPSSISLFTPDITALVPNQIDLNTIISGSSLFDPTFSTGLVTREVDFIPSGNSLYTPNVLASTYTITDVDFITSSISLFTPDVNALVPNQIDLNTIISGSSVFDPTISTGLINRQVDFIPSGNALYTPTLSASYDISVDYISSTKQLYTPDVTSPSVNIELFYLASQNSVFDPYNVYSSYKVSAPFIGSSNVVYDITTYLYYRPQIDFISSGNELYTPIFGGALPLPVDFIASSNFVYVPLLGEEAYEIDVILFDLHINLVVDKPLYFDTMLNRSLYIDQVVDKTLDLTVNYETEHEL